jgi:hypothetical protein
MKEYKQLIENLAFNKEPMIYANSGADHAEIVFSAIFRYSKKEIFMRLGDMREGVSNRAEYLYSLQSFLSKGGVLKLMASDFDFSNNTKLYNLLALYQFFNPEKVQIKKYNIDAFKPKETEEPVYFCTGDYRMYRIEYDTKKSAAYGSFNNTDIVERLRNRYNEEFEKAIEVSLD